MVFKIFDKRIRKAIIEINKLRRELRTKFNLDQEMKRAEKFINDTMKEIG